MTPEELDNLVRIGELKPASITKMNISTLIQSGLAYLEDAKNCKLGIESRFNLAFSAAYALSLSALWINGYSANKRYIVFECLLHTLNLSNEQWRALDIAHHIWIQSEYQGSWEIDKSLVESVIDVCDEMAAQLSAIHKPNDRN